MVQATTLSEDGVSVQFDVHGSGEIALVFVHGWCCNRRHWDRQIEYFAAAYTVVALDLVGHGTSGRDRTQWTISAFGQDVAAVVEHLGLKRVVLIGHSMGGLVILEAACRLSSPPLALVGVDTWHDIEQIRVPDQVSQAIAPLREDFAQTVRAVLPTWFAPEVEPELVNHIIRGMAETPPQIGISAAEATLQYAYLAEILRKIADEGSRKPLVATINSESFGATNVAAAQRYGVETMILAGVGHFVMLEDPLQFNSLLGALIHRVSAFID